VDQGRRHEDEFGTQIEVHSVRLFHPGKVLGRDLSDRDVANVDLLLPDEVQKQVEWALVVVQGEVQRRVASGRSVRSRMRIGLTGRGRAGG